MKKKKTLEFFFIALTSICDTLFMSFTIQMIKNRKKKKNWNERNADCFEFDTKHKIKLKQ